MTTLQPVRGISDGIGGISVGNSTLLRAAPEPRSDFGKWMATAGSTVASTVGSVAGVASGLDVDKINNLLNQQIQIQLVMQEFSAKSNIAKSQHETEMAPVRNMRVG